STTMPDAGDITQLLREIDRGNRDAENDLFQLVQDDLRRIANRRKREVHAVADFTTTGLIDVVFVHLVGKERPPAERRQFFGFAARKIHDLLIDELRRRLARPRPDVLDADPPA